jgi:hypothetical protein
MPRVKTLVTIALYFFAVSFIYQVVTKGFTNQDGAFKKYAMANLPQIVNNIAT